MADFGAFWVFIVVGAWFITWSLGVAVYQRKVGTITVAQKKIPSEQLHMVVFIFLCIGVLFVSVGVVNGYKRERIRYRFREEISNFASRSKTVLIDGELIVEPDLFIEELKKITSTRMRHSYPHENHEIELSCLENKINISIKHDPDKFSKEFFVFWPRELNDVAIGTVESSQILSLVKKGKEKVSGTE